MLLAASRCRGMDHGKKTARMPSARMMGRIMAAAPHSSNTPSQMPLKVGRGRSSLSQAARQLCQPPQATDSSSAEVACKGHEESRAETTIAGRTKTHLPTPKMATMKKCMTSTDGRGFMPDRRLIGPEEYMPPSRR